ncbi:TonB-dependent receptor domain-containing protein [Flavobacterium sp. 3HN19-14]|uniref:TonB-dependent receptor domain-containing protein n=1 Tax=Flavobacterium sp. 3HN19-14 TaxID=3448133 RepID=UPI003EE31F21
MIRIIFIITFMLISAMTTIIYGQNSDALKISISGNVLSEKQEVVADAVIYLMDASGEKLIKTETSNENGNFVFEDISSGAYSMKISVNGKNRFSGTSFSAAKNLTLPTIILQPEINDLNEVVISKAKPYIERQEGKMILNVESSIANTGSSAFEVLEKAPGVRIDNSDNISLRGKGGIIVQIDGKPSPMSGTNLANYLRGIPSGAIDKIEFITNPSSKYDASGSAIINIKMKKNKQIGTSGSISTSYGQGQFPKTNNGINLNHRNKKVNIFGSYNFAYREAFNKLLLDRRFYENGNFTGAYVQDNFLKMNFRNHIVRAGADFYASQKHTFGIVVNAVSNKFNPSGINTSDVLDATDTKISSFETLNHSRDKWHNQSINLNHKFVADTLGTELTTDFDYANYGNKTQQNFDTHYFDLSGNESDPAYLLHGDLNGNLNIFALKSDFVTFLKNKTKLETGIKSSYVKADNNLMFYDVSNVVQVLDSTKSNHFIYKENINAVYANASKKLSEKWSATLGLRIENTNVTGDQLVNNTSFKSSYTQLFPSALLTYTVNEKNSVDFNYSRRITRPSYDQLNPFKFFLDPTTYREGNPYLKPQTTHAIEVTHVYDQKIYTTLSFSRTTDNITEVIAPSDGDQKLTVQTNKNLNTADVYGLFVTFPVVITKWWSNNNSINVYYGSYSGTVANTTLINQGNLTYNLNSQNTIKLGKGFSAEFTGDYRGREVYAFMDVQPIWSVNLGLQKKFSNSTLKFAFNDIFFTSGAVANTEFTGYKEHFDVNRDTRVAVISYTYNFGGNATQRKRAGGAEDIKQRAGQNG